MTFRIGEALDYNPFEDEEDVVDSPTEFEVGEVLEIDPFGGQDPYENDPMGSDIDEPDEEGHSLWDIPRMMGKGAAGMAKTAGLAHSLLNPQEWSARIGGVIGDITHNEALQAYRDYTQKHGVSARLRQYGETADKYYDEKLSPAMKKSMKKTILASGKEEGFWGEGITDPWKIGGMIAESIPSTLVSMGGGALITKGLIRTGMKTAPKLIQGVLQKMVKKYGVNTVAGVVGGAIGEGGYAGFENANATFEEMMALPQEELVKSEHYREVYNSLPASLSDEQKHQYARKVLAMAAAGFVGTTTAVTTGIFGAPSGAFMGKLIGGEAGKSLWGNLIKGAITEGFFEEAPQSGIERLVSNISKRFLVDENQPLTEGVGEAMASGAIAGFAMGGGMAVAFGKEGDSEAKKLLTDGQDVTAEDILLGTDETAAIRKKGEGKKFGGDESIEAEEESEEFSEEELDELTAKQKKAPSAGKGRKGPLEGKKPQRKKPKQTPEQKKGPAAPLPDGMVQKPETDEDIEEQGKLSPEDDRRKIKRPGEADRRTEPGREPLAWDAPFRAMYTNAQKMTEEQFVKSGSKLIEKQSVGFVDLAKRLGETIEPDSDIEDVLKTVYGRIQSGMQPRKRTQEMSKEELQEAITTDYLTGLRNKHAFDIEDRRKKHVVSIDLDSLKYFNDNFGHQTGDEMLINFGNALRQITDADTYHISGDEFIIQSDDGARLDEILNKRVVSHLNKNPIIVTLPNGKQIKYEVQFSYGKAETITKAEAELHKHKAKREVEGSRAGRGEIPPGLPGGHAKGKRAGNKRKEVPEKEVAEPAPEVSLPATRPAENGKDTASQTTVSKKATQSGKLADWIVRQVGARKVIHWRDLFEAGNQYFEGTQSAGTYTPRDAYDAMELGINRYLLGKISFIYPSGERIPPEQIITQLKEVGDYLPTQSKRTLEQEDFQQFSTPPFLSYVANWVANIGNNDVYLEPSAGIGGLAIFGRMSNAARIYVNELSKRRSELLDLLNIADESFSEDAIQLDNILPDHVKPTVIIMNPPFSSTAGRLKKNMTKYGAQHVEQALRRLEPGGRLVAIVGKGMEPDAPTFRKWWTDIKKQYTVRANVGISGDEYRKYGTTFDNRLLVIDKTGPTKYDPVVGKVETVDQLPDLLKEVRNARQEAPQLDQAGESPPVQPPLPPSFEETEGPTTGTPPTRPESGGMGAGESQDQDAESGPGGSSGSDTDVGSGSPGPLPRPGKSGKGGGPSGPGDRDSGRTPLSGDREHGGLPPEEDGELSLDDLADLIDEVAAEEGITGETPPPPKPPKAPKAPTSKPPSSPSKGGGGYSDIANIINGLKEAQAPYGAELMHPEAYEKARPLFANEYQRFMAQPSAEPKGREKAWVRDALQKLTGMGVDFEIAKNWILHFYANDRPSLKTKRAPKKIDIKKAEKEQNELEDKLYERYKPTVRIAGAKPHPTTLDESAALGDTSPPPATYQPSLPQELIESGRVSDAQLEAVVYAGQAHDRVMPSGERKGFFAGHGTGVGKGRIIASIIMDNWNQGRKKAIWISEKKKLFDDAKRDLGYDKARKSESGIGWGEGADNLFYLKTKLGKSVKNKQGILFTTYATLGSKFGKINERQPSTLRDLKIRINQIVEWAGKDYDGVIAFDESHNMSNSKAQRGERGTKDPAKMALAGVMLQKRLPKARVIYVSATGATEVHNLAYAERLGLWGEGTSFSNKDAFITGISAAGISAMELVARDLKAQGLYLAPTLSYDGVFYDKIVHELDEKQRAKYDELAGAWQIVLHNIQDALGETMQGEDGNKRGAIWSQFWGGQQRFFNQVITTMQMGSGIAHIEKQLAAGYSAVLQLVNHGGSQLERALDAREKDTELEDLELGPKANLLEYIENAFPTQQYEPFVDEEGNERVRPVFDSAGKPVQNREALRMKEEMIMRIQAIQIPGSPLDMILHHFGTDNVAEVTGRKRRVVIDPDTGEFIEEKWSDAKALRDMEAFMDDEKRILVFSEKGGTGASYHADLDRKNQRKRVHYLVQPGWRADKAIQGLGRTHRSNQAQPPEYFLLTTDLEGQKRFISSIARRLDQLGALTKGQRQTGSQGIFQARDNLESPYASAALYQLYDDIVEGNSTITVEEFEEQTALKLVSETTGEKLLDLPPPTKFMNRLLTMTVEKQNKVFGEWADRIDRIIDAAAAAGTLDVGIETITGLNIAKAEDRIVNTDEATGAQTRYVRLEITSPSNRIAFEDLANVEKFYVNNKSGKIWGASPIRSLTDKTGNVSTYRTLTSTAGSIQRVSDVDLDFPAESAAKWTEITDKKTAADLWNKQYAEASPTITRDTHIMTGALLPIWDRLAGPSTVYRMQTDDGERILGRVIHANHIDSVLESLGVTDRQQQYSGQDLAKQIIDNNFKVRLVNRWRLKRVTVSGEERIELLGPDYNDWDIIRGYGVIIEKIGAKTRYFVPTGENSGPTMDAILKYKPVAHIDKPYAGPKLSETVLNEPQDLEYLFGRKKPVQMQLFSGNQLALFQSAPKKKGPRMPEPRQVLNMETTGDISHYGTKVSSPQEAAGLVSFLLKKGAEEAYIILTDAQDNVVQIHRLSKGDSGSAAVPVIETGGSMLRADGAKHAYFIHQHPSRDPSPSSADLQVSRALSNIGALRDIELKVLIMADSPPRVKVFELMPDNHFSNGRTINLTPELKLRAKKNLNTKLPVSERFITHVRGFKGDKAAMRVSDSAQASAMIKKLYHDMEGILLLDGRNYELGFIPWAKNETVKQFTARLISETERHNARAMIISLHDKGSTSNFIPKKRQEYINNILRDMAIHNMTIHEVLVGHVSMADLGILDQWKKAAGAGNKSSFFKAFVEDSILFSRKVSKPAQSLTVDQVQSAAEPLLSEMKARPPVTVLRRQAGLPRGVLTYLRDNGGENDIVVAAVHDGRVYLVADNIKNDAEVVRAVLHEIMGHYGTHAVLGDKADKILDSVYMSKRDEINLIAKEYGFNLRTIEGRRQAAEEWLAREAEMNPESKWIDRVVAIIRNWLRKINPKLSFSDTEIRALIARARQYVRTGQQISVFPAIQISQAPRFMKKKHQGAIDVVGRLPENVKHRFAQARGVPKKSWIERAREKIQFVRSQRYHFPDLYTIGNEREEDQLADVLRQHQEVPETAKDQAARKIIEFTRDLSQDEYEVFRIHVILSDMVRDIESGLISDAMLKEEGDTLPFGFANVQQIRETFETFKHMADQSPPVRKAILARRKLINGMVREMVKFKILKKEVLKHKDYFHHQVLAYWAGNQMKTIGASSADVRTHWRPWMTARKGSLMDYNTEYVEAEFAALAQQMAQIETARTLERVKNISDIYADLKTAAKAENLKNFYILAAKQASAMFGTRITPAEVRNDPKLDPLFGYRKNIDMASGYLQKMAYEDKLEVDSEWDDVLDSLAESYELKKMGIDEGVLGMSERLRVSDARYFAFLSYLIDKRKPGANWAATIFKAIQGRNKHIKGALGDNFVTFSQLIPDGYTQWKPDPNKGWFWANTVADDILQKIIAGDKALEDKDVRQMLAKGRDLIWVIPQGLASTMDNFRKYPEPNSLGRLADWLLGAWKQWVLINPRRWLRYNINNMSGDLDITLAYAPGIARPDHLKKALSDLRKWHNRKKLPDNIQAELDNARRKGVIGSGFAVQEVEDVLNIMSMDKWVREVLLGEKPNVAMRYWQKAKGSTVIRENMLRLAAYRWFRRALADGKRVYGASKPHEIDSIPNLDDKAAKLARELIGDYGNISAAGQYIRRRLMPFYSWMEINLPRYVYLMRNLRSEDRHSDAIRVRRGVAGIISKKVAGGGLKLAIKANLLMGAVLLWNMLAHKDEWEELGEAKRRQMHLIIGRNDDGTIQTIRFQGALSDALCFFGLEDWPADVADVVKDRGTIQDKLIEAPTALATKAIESIRPEPKMLFETLTEQSLYPDPLTPRPVRDTTEHILRTFSLDSIYRMAAGKPGRGKTMAQHMLADIKSLLVYSSDPGEQAYYDTRKMVFDWLDKEGDERPSGKPTKRSNALYYYRQALKYGDFKAAELYLKKYYELGGTSRTLRGSIKRAHPLASIPMAKRFRFRQSLGPQEAKRLKMALGWYDLTYRKGDLDLRLDVTKNMLSN